MPYGRGSTKKKPTRTATQARVARAKTAREFISKNLPTRENLQRKAGNLMSLVEGRKTKNTRAKAAEQTARSDRALIKKTNQVSDVKRVKAATKANQTDAKRYTVGKSKGGVSFKEAFAYHRKKGAKTFTWNGKKYTTKVK